MWLWPRFGFTTKESYSAKRCTALFEEIKLAIKAKRETRVRSCAGHLDNEDRILPSLVTLKIHGRDVLFENNAEVVNMSLGT